jgi:hypothetical protein
MDVSNVNKGGNNGEDVLKLIFYFAFLMGDTWE